MDSEARTQLHDLGEITKEARITITEPPVAGMWLPAPYDVVGAVEVLPKTWVGKRAETRFALYTKPVPVPTQEENQTDGH